MGRGGWNWIWLLGISAPFAIALSAEGLVVRLTAGNSLHVVAPGFHFLAGKPTERLKDGATVAFLGQISVSTDANATVQARAITRFAMSYDIWEERFSVSRFSVNKIEMPARSASHLSAAAAEAWCLENLALDISQFSADKTLWVRLELRAEEGRDKSGVLGDPGINLTRLIEIFSRPPALKQQNWMLESGPVRLADLRRAF